MDTIKATPIEQKFEIISNPYVVFTPFGYHPFVNVKNLDTEKEGKIIISPISLARKLREFFEIDSNHIAYNALLACGLNKEAKKFKTKYKVKLNKENPYIR